VKINRSDIPPMGAGWAAQPSSAADVRALFPDQPWLWQPEGDPYWRTVSREWTVTAELALVGRPAVYPRWADRYARGGAGLWQLLPAETPLTFMRRGSSAGRSMESIAMISLATDRQQTLRCAVAEAGGAARRQPPLWALVATALITPADHPLATGNASVAEVIERASTAAAGALDALLPPATGDAHTGRR